MSTEQLLTINDVAKRLAISPKTAQRRVYAGELPWTNVAKAGARRASIRIPESAVAEFIARHTTSAGRPPQAGPPRSPAAKPG